MEKKLSKHRVVTFLTREELEFLDKLERDMIFSTGKHLSRAQILQDAAELLSRTGMSAAGITSDEELMKRMQDSISRLTRQLEKGEA